jgi:hypothetical protein
MGEGEGWDEAREEEPEDDKDDSESDHDVTQFLDRCSVGGLPGAVSESVI